MHMYTNTHMCIDIQSIAFLSFLSFPLFWREVEENKDNILAIVVKAMGSSKNPPFLDD